jgi:hypothetical protein
MREMDLSKSNQNIIKYNLKEAIRFPAKAHESLMESNTAAFVYKYFENLKYSRPPFSSTAVPDVLFSIRDLLYKDLPFGVGKIIDMLKPK